MTIWRTLGKVLTPNREDKWPLPVQFLVFLLFEALFIYGKYAATYALYDSSVYTWVMNVFGDAHAGTVLTLLSTLIAAEVCAWCVGLQRYVTFGGHTPRRWTILPMALGYLALSLLTWLVSTALLTTPLPLPTENPLVYPVLHSLLYVGIVAVFCAGIFHLRRGNKPRVLGLTAAEALLVALLVLCSVWQTQLDQRMLEQAYAQSAGQQTTVTTIGVTEDESINELLSAFLTQNGIDAGNAVIVGPGEALSVTPADPFAAYEEAMAPANRLGDILQWVQLIPIFFAMKRWLFPLDDTPKEVAA